MDRGAWRDIVHGVTTERLTISLSHFQRPSGELCRTGFGIVLQAIGIWNIYSLTLIHSGIVIPNSQYPWTSVRCIQGIEWSSSAIEKGTRERSHSIFQMEQSMYKTFPQGL